MRYVSTVGQKLLLFAVVAALSGCSNTSDISDFEQELRSLARPGDVWLEKEMRTAPGYTPVAFIFGHMDDLASCNDMATRLNETQSSMTDFSARYRCSLVIR